MYNLHLGSAEKNIDHIFLGKLKRRTIFKLLLVKDLNLEGLFLDGFLNRLLQEYFIFLFEIGLTDTETEVSQRIQSVFV
jgi:hypothetical protein